MNKTEQKLLITMVKGGVEPLHEKIKDQKEEIERLRLENESLRKQVTELVNKLIEL